MEDTGSEEADPGGSRPTIGVLVEQYSSTADLGPQLSLLRRILVGEGWATFVADAEDVPYVIVDNGTMADFLDRIEDADLIDRLVTLLRFPTEESRIEWVRQGVAELREHNVSAGCYRQAEQWLSEHAG